MQRIRAFVVSFWADTLFYARQDWQDVREGVKDCCRFDIESSE